MNLTMEILSSLIYIISPNTTSTVGTIKFHMFNVEYAYTTNQHASLMSLSHGEGVLCGTLICCRTRVKNEFKSVVKRN